MSINELIRKSDEQSEAVAISFPPSEPNLVGLSKNPETEQMKDDSNKIMHGHISNQDPDYIAIPLSRAQFVSVYLSLSMAIFLVVSTALPSIAAEFHALDEISWIGTGYFLTSTAFSPIYGSLCDIFGRKLTFLVAIFLFEAGSLICGAAPSILVLILGRLIAGVGGAGIQVVVFIIVSDIVSLRERGKYQGITGAVFGLASVVGPLLGGVFTDKLSWRWSFYINLPIGLITSLIVVFYLKFPRPQGSILSKIHKIDILGLILVVGASSCLLLPLTFGGGTWPWLDPRTLSLFALFIVLIGLLFLVELKFASNPMIPARLFENRSVALVCAIAFLHGVCFYSISFYVPTFYQLVIGDSAMISGLESIPLSFGVVALSIISGQLISRTGRYKYWFFISPVFLITGQVLLSTMTVSTSRVAMVFYLLLAGVGIGCLIQVRVLAVQASVGASNLAVATSTSNFFRNAGGMVGIAVAGTIFTNRLENLLGPELARTATNDRAAVLLLPNADAIISALATSLGAAYQQFTIAMACSIIFIAIFIKEYRTDKAREKANIIIRATSLHQV